MGGNTPEDIIRNDWANSEDERNHMLDQDFTEVSISFVCNPTCYTTAVFVHDCDCDS